jgi:hypothetical protein
MSEGLCQPKMVKMGEKIHSNSEFFGRIKWLINLDENRKILIKNGYNQLHKFEFKVHSN